MAVKSLTIAIAGAGPAGLAAALYLKRAGHSVTLFERFSAAQPLGSGLILQPTGLAVLADLGLESEITRLGARIDRLAGHDSASGRVVLDVRYDALKGSGAGLAVHRAALFSVLHDAVQAENIPLETGFEVAGLHQSADGVALMKASGGTSARFDLTIDASGSRSLLKAYAGAKAQRPLAYGAFWATLDWHDQGFDRNALLQRYSRASIMAGVMPIGRPQANSGEKAAFFWSLKPAQAAAVKAAGLDAWKQAVLDHWPETTPLLSQIASFDDLTLASYSHHTLSTPAGRRLAVIGDAAHSTSPQLGQGANMALLDARALSHALDISPDLETALSAYCAMRRGHVRLFQALSAMFTPFYQSDSRVFPFVRDRLVAPLSRVPPVPGFLAKMVSGTLGNPLGKIGLA
ncbi:MAG: NAD(P)/FAD-dependent oxidoreductase [Rhizobiaceae bacterium]